MSMSECVYLLCVCVGRGKKTWNSRLLAKSRGQLCVDVCACVRVCGAKITVLCRPVCDYVYVY